MKSIFVWGVPRIDCLSVKSALENRLDSFPGRLSQGQSLIELSIRMGGCYLLEELLRQMVPPEKVEVHSRLWQIIEDKDGRKALQDPKAREETMLKELAPFLEPRAAVNWTRWEVKERDNKQFSHGEPSSPAFRISEWLGYEIGHFDRERYLGLTESLGISSDIIVFDDHKWLDGGEKLSTSPLLAIQPWQPGDGNKPDHILMSFEARDDVGNSCGLQLFSNYRDILTVVTSAADLRRFDVNIGAHV